MNKHFRTVKGLAADAILIFIIAMIVCFKLMLGGLFL